MEDLVLSQDDFLILLQKKLKNKNVNFKSAEIVRLTGQKYGFTGHYFTLKITYIFANQLLIEHFFIKSQLELDNKLGRKVSSLNIYNKEIFFYNFLCKSFRVRDFAPELYLSKDGRTLVFEDLKVSGFATAEKQNWFFDISRIHCGLKALAHLHAASFMYEEDKSKDLGKLFRLDKEYPEMFAERMLTTDDSENVLLQYILEGQRCLMALIELLDEDDHWKNDLKKRLERNTFFHDFQLELPYRKACSHADLWTNNIMFKCQDDKAVDCRLVDFQLLRYFHSAFDVLLLIFNNSRVELYSKNLSEFLTYYHNVLKSVLLENGYSIDDIFPWNHFQEGVDIYMYATRFITACNHTMLFLHDVDILKQNNVDESDLEQLLYQNRTVLVLKIFKQNELCRDIISEDLHALRNLVLAKNSR